MIRIFAFIVFWGFVSLPLQAATPLLLPLELSNLPAQDQASISALWQEESNNPLLLHHGLVQVNLEPLGQSLDQASPLALLLPTGESLLVHAQRQVYRGERDLSWKGRLEEDGSPVYLVLTPDGLSGEWHWQRRHFRLRWLKGAYHSLQELKPDAFPECGLEDFPLFAQTGSGQVQSSADGPTSPAQGNDDGSSIDVLVVYSQAVASRGDIRGEVRTAIDQANDALSQAGVSMQFRLVHMSLVDYRETGESSQDLIRLAETEDGYLDQVHDLRDQYSADLVALVTQDMEGYCGLGYLNGANPYDAYAFSVTQRDCLSNYTLAHEMGHNLGLAHDVYVSPSGGAYSYSHGYVDVTHGFRTVMAYSTLCSSYGISCPRISSYSSTFSGVSYQGYAVGDSTANAAQSLENTKTAIARFRDSSTAEEEAEVTGCFVVSATYGTFLAPQVDLFRRFRDQVLLSLPGGQVLVDFYYRHSPAWAAQVQGSPSLRALAMLVLAPLALVLAQPWLVLGLAALALGLGLRSRRRHG